MLVHSMQAFTCLSNIACHLLLFWLQTLAVINSESCQTLFPSFGVQSSEFTVLIDWNYGI